MIVIRRIALVIPSIEAAKAINYHRGDALVVSTSAALRDWGQVSRRRDLDIDLKDCMDRAPAVGLGLSLAQPHRKVLVLDCDATLRTDLASLATVGESRPGNLVHFVFEDAAYSSTDGVPIRGIDNLDFISMAQGAGYARTFQFDNLEEFFIGLEEVMVQSGPTFVLIKVVRQADLPPFPEQSMAEGWARVRQTLMGEE
jgi:thiamine pyrophosphate-dependent acetolactate synthase large subunit-like protein